MLVDSDEHVNASTALPLKELNESAKEDSAQVSEKLVKKELEIKETKKVYVVYNCVFLHSMKPSLFCGLTYLLYGL